MIWNQLTDLSNRIETLFDKNLARYTIEEPIDFSGWKDVFWESDQIRKCHLKIIDNRETSKLWLMHITIFPNINSNLPILGFDIVSGQNKITGSFFDFSPVCKRHEFHDHFKDTVNGLSWNKPRDLPEWATQIFSSNMIAAGNIKTMEEVEQLSMVCFNLIDYYIENAPKFDTKVGNFKQQQNFYCSQQKLNPHLHRSILAMGISEADKNRYVEKVLFPEV